MILEWLEVERYKAYRERTRLELKPLTILVGRNNAGKSALARAVALLAGGLQGQPSAPDDPLPLASHGIEHGTTFHDLIAGGSTHGHVRITARFAKAEQWSELSTTVQAVVSGPGKPVRQVVSEWVHRAPGRVMGLERKSLELADATYLCRVDDGAGAPCDVTWNGLLPWFREQEESLREVGTDLRAWSRGVRYLRSPRSIQASGFRASTRNEPRLEADGREAPPLLAANAELFESVRAWYERAFSVRLTLRPQGEFYTLGLERPGNSVPVPLDLGGQGLGQVLPVAAMALSAASVGDGVDIIEHPKAELHPGAHAAVADLVLDNLSERGRPTVVETHSEMMLLRTRRRIAEGILSPEDVSICWVDSDEEGSTRVSSIGVTPEGDLTDWPEGVFTEDYEEVLAIRRAARERQPA